MILHCHCQPDPRGLSLCTIRTERPYDLISMESRVFALIIGIDVYLSGNIWNLQSCVDDAERIKQWLTHDLSVPESHIITLHDREATKRAIEDNIMAHFVNNAAIQSGDAMLIYFAGHGSSLSAPTGWMDDPKATARVDILCPFDHDTLSREGRVAGISDRSLSALINDVSTVKGNNITLILDCCFTLDSASSGRNRRHTRCAPTYKSQPDDLYSGLWQSARGRDYSNQPSGGVFNSDSSSHVTLSACGPDGHAIENKHGGHFTTALLEAVKRVPLHRTSYDQLIEETSSLMSPPHRPSCTGTRKHQPFFDNIAFLPDPQFVELDYLDGHLYRLGVGSLSHLKKGSKLTVHMHNLHGSANPPIAVIKVQDVHPLWCLARSRNREQFIPKGCYARVNPSAWVQRTLRRVRKLFRTHHQRPVTQHVKRSGRKLFCSNCL